MSDLKTTKQTSDELSINKSKRTTPKKQSKNESDEDIEMIDYQLKLTRSLKVVQEDYQKFTAMKMRTSSSNASGDMANPGTEVYAVDLKWLEQWKQAANGGGQAGNLTNKFTSQQKGSYVSGKIKATEIPQTKDIPDSPHQQQEVQLDYFSNQRIVVPRSEILTCSDESNAYNNILQEDLVQGKDYQLISREQWQIIESTYTNPDILPVYPIRRYYEKTGMGIRTFPDVNYHKFEVCLFNPSSNDQLSPLNQVYFSKKRTWDDLKSRMVKLMKESAQFSGKVGPITKDNIRIWSCSISQLEVIRSYVRKDSQVPADEQIKVKGYCLDSFINHSIDQIICDGKKSEDEESGEEEEKSDRDIMLVEVMHSEKKQYILAIDSSKDNENMEIVAQCQYCFKVKQLSIHCRCMSVSYCSAQCQQNDFRFHQEKCNSMETIEDWDLTCIQSADARLGLTGLKNLKNSCYMSSSIQCLSHAIGLTNYFLKGHFKGELNYKNPLGAKGQLAIAYGKLLKQLWYDDKSSLAPWQFKKTISKFASHFNNFEQQDSQELLNFMLDGLHEDLNRVQHKPIVPQIESEGFDDEKDAEDSWQNHLKRNQSIIVDLMHGQFKSTVKCPDCEKLSITFDPFMSVSLPIPEIKIVDKTFYWVPYDTSKPCVQDNFKFKSLEQIKTLRRYIATSFDVYQEQFELVVIQDDTVKRILPRYEQISSLNVNNIFIFAMETPPQSFQTQLSSRGTGPRESFNVPIGAPLQLGSDQWNEKKGASELSKKLKQNHIQVILNFQIFNQPGSMEEEPESFFPRIVYLKLDESLIQAHLDIFEYLKPLFTLYLEHKENLSQTCRKFFLKRKRVPVPERVKTSLWNNMTLVQQYEAVFGPMDPSRRKREDLPYFIQIMSRQDFGVDRGRCVYCAREQCSNCPLPFEEMTLREYLNLHGVATQSYFYYEDHQHKSLLANSNKFDKKKVGNPAANTSQAALLSTPQKKQQANNLEFELQISFNANKCWALYENMVRSRKYAKSIPEKAAERQSLNLFQNDKVTIDDCFRQFSTPEKLSHQNTWFCSRCKMHKQAVKKFQIFKSPPILVINLKRFKGMQQKQNTLVHFPLQGLDLNNFIISQRQKDSEPLIYDLFGVSNHQGQLQAGHYTAYAKNDGTWYRFNDDEIEDVENENQIVSSLAYNLFYARRDINFSSLDYQTIRNVVKSPSEQPSSNQSSQSQIRGAPVNSSSLALRTISPQQQLNFQNVSIIDDHQSLLPGDSESVIPAHLRKHWEQDEIDRIRIAEGHQGQRNVRNSEVSRVQRSRSRSSDRRGSGSSSSNQGSAMSGSHQGQYINKPNS